MTYNRAPLDAPGGSAGGVLVIGYGSTLRSDDGVGWHAAARLAADPRLAGVEVLAVHQLTPELALDMSRAALVILIDASADEPPGAIAVRPLAAEWHDAAEGGEDGATHGSGAAAAGGEHRVDGADADPAADGRRDRAEGPADHEPRGRGSAGATSHHVGPGELLALAHTLYGAAPAAVVVSVGVADMQVGETLSPAVAAALPAVSDVVIDLIRQRSLPPASR